MLGVVWGCVCSSNARARNTQLLEGPSLLLRPNTHKYIYNITKRYKTEGETYIGKHNSVKYTEKEDLP